MGRGWIVFPSMQERDSVRLWPGVAAAVVQWAVRFGLPAVNPEASAYGVMGALACAAAVVVWWLGFSRLGWVERLMGVGLAAAGLAAGPLFLHASIARGMMGLMFVIVATPFVCAALVGWAAVQGRMGVGARRLALAAAVLGVCAGWGLVRTDGIDGQGQSQLAWRWTPDAEQMLLKVAGPAAPAAAEQPAGVTEERAAAAPAREVRQEEPVEWPGFRGPGRDGVVRGVRIGTDWQAAAPAEAWRRPVGPGWSSMAAGGGLLYTQEQRGEEEVVSCYRLRDGAAVWMHRERTRFWESNAGAGPRGTPALAGGRVFAMGATGVLVALEARTGKVAWRREAAKELGVKTPEWGFAGSPLVVGGLVVAAVSGRMAAYDRETGELRWETAAGGGSYSSPHLVERAGRREIVLLNGKGAMAVAAEDGRVVWRHAWEGAAMLQPAVTGDGGLLLTTGGATGGAGTRRIGLSAPEREEWTSRGLKPYYNDLVVHEGHAYGFDGGILACVELKTGERRWKGGRYGHGQMLLLAEEAMLLVVSEEGEVALVRARPEGYEEVARMKGVEGKTWNHPVVAGGMLVVRNGQEMAAWRVGR